MIDDGNILMMLVVIDDRWMVDDGWMINDRWMMMIEMIDNRWMDGR